MLIPAVKVKHPEARMRGGGGGRASLIGRTSQGKYLFPNALPFFLSRWHAIWYHQSHPTNNDWN